MKITVKTAWVQFRSEKVQLGANGCNSGAIGCNWVQLGAIRTLPVDCDNNSTTSIDIHYKTIGTLTLLRFPSIDVDCSTVSSVMIWMLCGDSICRLRKWAWQVQLGAIGCNLVKCSECRDSWKYVKISKRCNLVHLGAIGCNWVQLRKMIQEGGKRRWNVEMTVYITV